jgi:hypothetical protein
MPTTQPLTLLLRQLKLGAQLITFERLIAAAIRGGSARIQALLEHNREKQMERCSSGPASPEPYRSRRDWLLGIRQVCELRLAAARACGYPVCGILDVAQDRGYTADTVLKAALTAEARLAERAACSPGRIDPLGSFGELSPNERRIVEVLSVNELLGLRGRTGQELTVGGLAQVADPVAYPGNCQAVIGMVCDLTTAGTIERYSRDGSAGLSDTLRLSAEAVREVLADLASDGISGREAKVLKWGVEQDTWWSVM